jgi:hypothetical protein
MLNAKTFQIMKTNFLTPRRQDAKEAKLFAPLRLGVTRLHLSALSLQPSALGGREAA